MLIMVKLGEPLWKVVGEKTVKVELGDHASLGDVFSELDRRHPTFLAEARSGEFELPYTLFVNDTMVQWPKVAETPLKDGDKVFIFMAVSGG